MLSHHQNSEKTMIKKGNIDRYHVELFTKFVDKLADTPDGDGSMLMHMGALPIIGCHGGANLVHIVLNNQSHESVGGQPTVAGHIDIGQIALASAYKYYYCATDEASLQSHWSTLSRLDGPILFEIKIATGSRDNLGRPTSSPVENKLQFMRHAGSL